MQTAALETEIDTIPATAIPYDTILPNFVLPEQHKTVQLKQHIALSAQHQKQSFLLKTAVPDFVLPDFVLPDHNKSVKLNQLSQNKTVKFKLPQLSQNITVKLNPLSQNKTVKLKLPQLSQNKTVKLKQNQLSPFPRSSFPSYFSSILGIDFTY